MPDDLKDLALTVTLDADTAGFLRDLVKSGEFESVETALAKAIALLRDHQEEIEEIRALLIEGEESGFIDDFDFDEFLARKRAEFDGRCRK